jgi:mannose-6-phosphate isomerase-like protein (cupin superfamily)|tara:strand:- start:220 stop:555 length:336 start_codon:yes stop_codon:yes gene_type:complete
MLNKVSIKDIGGKLVKDNAQYVLKDNKFLNSLVLSSTMLRANQQTNGHNHKGQEEIYFFISGQGTMTIDERSFEVNKGDVVLIPDGAFHKVSNTGHLGLYFVCVFNGERYE